MAGIPLAFPAFSWKSPALWFNQWPTTRKWPSELIFDIVPRLGQPVTHLAALGRHLDRSHAHRASSAPGRRGRRNSWTLLTLCLRDLRLGIAQSVPISAHRLQGLNHQRIGHAPLNRRSRRPEQILISCVCRPVAAALVHRTRLQPRAARFATVMITTCSDSRVENDPGRRG